MDRPADISCDALVVGGGAAGIAAAVELRSAGLSVELAEQRPALGGAYYRQPAGGAAATQSGDRRSQRWSRLKDELRRAAVIPRLRHVFLGVDTDGFALLDDREAGRVRTVRTRAVIVATGAVERVLPRPGWELDGVMTAGGVQMLIKETGEAPRGDLLIAGSGPLTVALAADLARLGRPPVAVVEAGDPLAHPLAALRLAAFPELVAEATAHLARMRAGGTPWLRGSRLASITREDGRLVATVEDRTGAIRRFRVDTVALHDGIRPNDFGLPSMVRGEPFVLRAGDCREALGVGAAEADGRAAAREAAALLAGTAPQRDTPEVSRQRRAQAVLAALFKPVRDDGGLSTLPDETVLCRCEGRTVGQLRQMLTEPDPVGPREIKLNGRFGMGSCQGRFCADNVQALIAAARPGTETGPLSRDRWPARPVLIAALAAQEEAREE